MKRLPRGLRRGHDDSIACKHRDLSCCPECLKAYQPELVDVMGRAYWIPDPTERAELLAMLASPHLDEDTVNDVCTGCGTIGQIGAPCSECERRVGPEA